MTATMTRRRALWALVAVVALAVAGLRLASDATTGTTAAWTDPVYASTNVTLGEWTSTPPPIVTDCRVYWQATNLPTGETCTPDASVANVWPPEAPVGQRYATVNFTFSPALPYDKYAVLTFDLEAAFEYHWTGPVSTDDWDWRTSDIATNWPVAALTSCTLPSFSARTYTSAANGTLQVNENGQNGHCPAGS